MSRRNKYEGPNSWYAVREGAWVPEKGVGVSAAIGIAALILRDYRRGWTYASDGRRIPMTSRLFTRRLHYLIALCRKHFGDHRCRTVRKLVRYVYRYRSLPPTAVVPLAGPNAKRLAEELVARGIAKAVRIYRYEGAEARRPIVVRRAVAVARRRRLRA